MGSIISAKFTQTNQINVTGIDMKQGGTEDDVELWQSVLGFGKPTIMIINDSIVYNFKSGAYTSDKPNVKVRIRDKNGAWTNQVVVSK
jgi:hypothetical protein